MYKILEDEKKTLVKMDYSSEQLAYKQNTQLTVVLIKQLSGFFTIVSSQLLPYS
jgi:hypothetical protein